MKNEWPGRCRVCDARLPTGTAEVQYYLRRPVMFCAAHADDLDLDGRIAIVPRRVGGYVVDLDGQPWCVGGVPEVFSTWERANTAARDELRRQKASAEGVAA